MPKLDLTPRQAQYVKAALQELWAAAVDWDTSVVQNEDGCTVEEARQAMQEVLAQLG